MAETTTITRPSPIIEGSLTAFLKSIDKLGAGAVPANFAGIDPSAITHQRLQQSLHSNNKREPRLVD